MYHLFCRKLTGDKVAMVRKAETASDVFSFILANVKKFNVIRIVEGKEKVLALVDKEEEDETVDIAVEIEVPGEDEPEEEPKPEKKKGRGRPRGSYKKKPKDEQKDQKPMTKGQKIAMYGKHKECEDCPIYLVECNEPEPNDPKGGEFVCEKKKEYEEKQEA